MRKEEKLEIRISAELLEALKKAAKEEETSCSAIGRKAIKKYLESLSNEQK